MIELNYLHASTIVIEVWKVFLNLLINLINLLLYCLNMSTTFLSLMVCLVNDFNYNNYKNDHLLFLSGNETGPEPLIEIFGKKSYYTGFMQYGWLFIFSTNQNAPI